MNVIFILSRRRRGEGREGEEEEGRGRRRRRRLRRKSRRRRRKHSTQIVKTKYINTKQGCKRYVKQTGNPFN